MQKAHGMHQTVVLVTSTTYQSGMFALIRARTKRNCAPGSAAVTYDARSKRHKA
jgi:hypothetical protein